MLVESQPTYQTYDAVSTLLLHFNSRSAHCKLLLPSFSARRTALLPAPAPARTPLALSSHPQNWTRPHEPFRGIQHPGLQDSQLHGAHTIFFAVLFCRFLATRHKLGEVGWRVEHKRKSWESLAVSLRDLEACNLIGAELHNLRLRLLKLRVWRD